MNGVIMLYLSYKENIIKKTVDAANTNGQAIELPSLGAAHLVKRNRPTPKFIGSREVYFFLSLDSSATRTPKAIINDSASYTVISLTPFLSGVSQTTLEEPYSIALKIIPQFPVLHPPFLR